MSAIRTLLEITKLNEFMVSPTMLDDTSINNIIIDDEMEDNETGIKHKSVNMTEDLEKEIEK